jgi:ATP-binding cassette subfamily B protein
VRERSHQRLRARIRGSIPGAKPPLAVVGSEVGGEERMFGRAFDGHVIARFMVYVRPYRKRLAIAVGAVLVFTFTQLSLPLIIRGAIDNGLLAAEVSRSALIAATLLFVAVISLNYAANWLQEWIAQMVAEEVLFDLRRAMFFHLQFVALAFMDRTEAGRLMSRLQGDVGSLQEFLESTVFAIGDLVLLLGIMAILVVLNWQLGLVTMMIVPILLLVRVVWLPRARKAFLHARETSSIANGALAESINGVRLIQEMGRESVNFDLYDE